MAPIDGTGTQPQRVRRWRAEADCSIYEQRWPVKPGTDGGQLSTAENQWWR